MSGLILFFIVIFFGLLIEKLVFLFLENLIGKPFRTNHKYSLGKHVSLMSIPILGLIALLIAGHNNYAALFVGGAIVGTLAEFLCGKIFHSIEGQRVWTYRYWSFSGYTSIFSIPYWGGAALALLALSKVLDIIF